MTTITNRDITRMGVTELAAGVAGGRLTPAAVAEAYLAHIEAIEPSIQAFSYLDLAAVRAQAAELTTEAEAGKLRGPLHGVPVAIKDEFHVAGMPTGMREIGRAHV